MGLSLSLSSSLRVSLSLSSPLVHPPSSYLTSLSHTIFKNMAHVGSLSHFVFVIVIAFSSSAIIIFDILESYHFQKYGTCWVFESFCLCHCHRLQFIRHHHI